MKTICVLTYERTGSGWLSSAFDTDETISIHEIFSDDPLLWMEKSLQIFKKIYNVEPELLAFLSSIYHYNNFFIDVTSYHKIKTKILSKNIYRQKILELFISICKKHNFNLVFKLFPEHIKFLSSDFLSNNIDFVILNYRQDLLKNYYSLEKAKVSGIWFSDQQSRQNSEPNLLWNENHYNKYASIISKNIELLKTIYENFKHDKFIISYEDLHENNLLTDNIEKTKFLNNKLLSNNMNIKLNSTEFFKKQNSLIAFLNQEEFISSIDLDKIKKKICL